MVHRRGSTVEGEHLVGMTRIWERLYLGSLNDAAQLAVDNPFGITAVLSLCSSKVLRKASQINYTCMPIAEFDPSRNGSLKLLWEQYRKASDTEIC